MITTTEVPTQVIKTDSLGRLRVTAQRREDLLNEFERSGLSGQKFAEVLGLKYQTFASPPYDEIAAIGKQKTMGVRPNIKNTYDRNSSVSTMSVRPVTASGARPRPFLVYYSNNCTGHHPANHPKQHPHTRQNDAAQPLTLSYIKHLRRTACDRGDAGLVYITYLTARRATLMMGN